MLFLAVWEERVFFYYFCLAENSRFSSLAPFCNEHFFCCCWKKTHKTKQKTAREAGAVYSETANGLLLWTNWKRKDLCVNSGEHSSLAPQPLLAKPLWLVHLPVPRWAQELGAMARLLLLVANPGGPRIVIQ